MEAFSCRHCGRPIAVPGSNCPWCGKQIMVICAACKAYTNNEVERCEHCGAALRPDRMEEIALHVHHPVIAALAQDSGRAQLVASAVVAARLDEFLRIEGKDHASVLGDVFGPTHDAEVRTAAVIFAAYAYLAGNGYCSLEWDSDEKNVKLEALRHWDGQEKCLERVIADQSWRTFNTYEATDRSLRELMNFRAVTVRVRASDGSRVGRLPELSAVAAVGQMARLTVLPEHDSASGFRDTSDVLARFVQSDEQLARHLGLEILRIVGALSAG